MSNCDYIKITDQVYLIDYEPGSEPGVAYSGDYSKG